MKYKRFEDLPVWNDSIAFAVDVLEFTSASRELLAGFVDLRFQIERASVSVSNNIAEGFERGSNAELIRFLCKARGSCAECRSITHIFGRIRSFRVRQGQILKLSADAENISGQLFAWIESLKNSKINSEGYFEDRELPRHKRVREAKRFQELLEKAMRGEPVDFDRL
jgi:four helix bundle protein